MSRFKALAASPFRALAVRNYRFFFFGQIVSISGTWMQSVAQAWLVLKLSNNGALLGIVIALQTLPVLLFGAWGGVIADRFDKRKILVCTQVAAALLAVLLGVLTLTGVVTVWMVGAVAFGLGMVNVIDIPTRQAFVSEMVGREHMINAITLNGVIMNSGRLVGPAIAGVLIATVGIAPCFLINAASYGAVIAGLLWIRGRELFRAKPVPRAPGQLVEGIRYVWRTPELRTPLLMMALVGTFAYEFTVTLPIFTKFTFHQGAEVFGLMTSFMAGGSVLGGLVTAARAKPTARRLGIACAVFGVLILMTAAAPTLPLALLLLLGTGAASIFFAAMCNTTIQLTASSAMRGRVMALYAVAFMGSTPIGGPVVGFIGQQWGGRAALAVGGLSALLAAAFGWRSLNRQSRRYDRVETGKPTELGTLEKAPA
ncbi:MAG TPA: MFS transporter [Candidatus Solibacter sp.]|nr:MFS transporter [Candidatus Solibacter sp.]